MTPTMTEALFGPHRTYQAAVAFPGAKVIFCDGNRPARSLDYDSDAHALDPALELDQLDCLGVRTQ